MKKAMKILSLATALISMTTGVALATPSTQIWSPSPDVQPFGVLHLGIDNYFRASNKPKSPPTAAATRDANIYDIGLTVGVLPFEKLQMEVGVDYLVSANEPNDNHPFSFNVKLGTPEDSLFKGSPAIAVGIYNAGPTNYDGPSSGSLGRAVGITSGQNITYGLIAKTLPAIGAVPSLGRISAGGYHGSARAFVDPNGNSANDGVILTWDRTMSEISDKLWMAVDYFGGNNVNGALNIGFAWSFAKNVSVIFAYDIYKEKALAGNNTFTTQLDINFP
ncbi:hypothetical protein [Geobacter sp.]|uniref:hypothetical protein n=1 Tax=Geobacter sp. TaxID=46610 RepID=UPI0026301BC1|nr:hypothetical protein [Geobacter sp.]